MEPVYRRAGRSITPSVRSLSPFETSPLKTTFHLLSPGSCSQVPSPRVPNVVPSVWNDWPVQVHVPLVALASDSSWVKVSVPNTASKPVPAPSKCALITRWPSAVLLYVLPVCFVSKVPIASAITFSSSVERDQVLCQSGFTDPSTGEPRHIRASWNDVDATASRPPALRFFVLPSHMWSEPSGVRSSAGVHFNCGDRASQCLAND